MNPFAPWTEYWIFGAVMSFVMGINWGSFFNVCIYRLPVKKSIVRPGSHCYHCGTFLKWYDNIPLISYPLLRGNCRSCGTHFSARYFFVELLSGLLFLGIFIVFGINWAVPFHFVFVSLLLVGVFTDIDHFILPDGITIGGLVFAIATAAVLGRHAAIAQDIVLSRDIYHSFFSPNQLSDNIALTRPLVLVWSIAGAAFGYAMLWCVGLLGRIMFHKEALGGGDIKLFAFLGAYLGAMNCVWILFLSTFLGAVIGLTLILTHKLLRRDEYQELVLPRAAAVKTPWRTVDFRSRAQTQLDAVASLGTPSPPDEGVQQSDEQRSTGNVSEPEQSAIVLRIARRTVRQMHHIPYGPYIAVAAVVVLVCHEWIDRNAREFLMLPF
ncbi:MAG: prepilin peptidase [Candidatus Sumerlaeaceae bacterium]